MADITQFNQFGGTADGDSPSRDCLHTEAILADVLDNALSPEDQAAFDQHIAGCTACAAMLADARQGLAWLEMLRPFEPAPPADLVSRILAETSVRAAADAADAEQQQRAAIVSASLMGSPALTSPLGRPSHTPGRVLPFRSRLAEKIGPTLGAMLQTRTAMTAAMAFFSVALTLDLLGVHVSALRARDLTPSSLRRNASETNARIVRYYESLRVVYELESRVHDIQHANDADAEPQTSIPPADPATGNPAKPAGGAAPEGTTPQGDGSHDRDPHAAPKPGSSRGSSPPATSSQSHNGSDAGHEPASAARNHMSVHPMPTAATPGSVLPVLFRRSAPDLMKGATA